MSYKEFKKVYWNEVDQRIWRTDTTSEKIPIVYNYIGTMTETEYELLIEILFELFDDDKITLQQFVNIFGDLRCFCDRIKNLTDDI
jgi:hypothetical protein